MFHEHFPLLVLQLLQLLERGFVADAQRIQLLLKLLLLLLKFGLVALLFRFVELLDFLTLLLRKNVWKGKDGAKVNHLSKIDSEYSNAL